MDGPMPSNAEVAKDVAPPSQSSSTPIVDAADENGTALERSRAKLALSDAGFSELSAARGEGPQAEAAYLAALRDRGTELTEVLSSMTPDEQLLFMETGGQDRFANLLKAATDSGDATSIESIVASVVGAGEGVGDTEVLMIAQAVRDVGIDGIGPQIVEAMRGGAGSKLAVELAFGESGPGRGPNRMSGQVRDFLDESSARFGSSSAKADELRGQLVAGSLRMRQAGMSEAEVSKWEAEFREKNKADFERAETDAELYASTLNGRVLGQSTFGDVPVFQVDNAGALARSQAGGQAAAEALLRAGQGQDTWLDSTDISPEDRKALVTQGAMQGIGALSFSGDIQGIDAILAGLERVDPESAAALEGVREQLANLPEGLQGKELQSQLVNAFSSDSEGLSEKQRSLLQRLGISANLGTAAALAGAEAGLLDDFSGSRAPASLGRLSSAFGMVGGGIAMLAETEDPARFMLAAAETGFDAVSLVKSFGKGIGRGTGLAAGALFSLVDAGLYLRDGNYAAAGASLLPLGGMVIGMALAGPLGAAIGGGVGSILNTTLGAMGVLDPDQIATLVQPAIQQGLLDRGFNKDLATELSELLSKNGVAEKFEYAAASSGMTAGELLDQLAVSPRGYASWFIEGADNSLEFSEEEDGVRRPEMDKRAHRYLQTIQELSPTAAAAVRNADSQWMGNPLFTAQKNADAYVNSF